jgi:poly [ADP-ribose] polymerase
VFGMKRPPPISSKAMLKAKLEMVESLADIEIATKLIKELQAEVTENPVDLKYQSLGCSLSVMEQKSSDFKLISTYVKNTHGRTHNSYDLELLNVFEVRVLYSLNPRRLIKSETDASPYRA